MPSSLLRRFRFSIPCLFALVATIPVVSAAPQDTSAAAPQNKLRYFRPAPGAAPTEANQTGKAVATPQIAVVNSASYLTGICPGGFATIFGNNLTDVSGVVIATTNPLPLVLSNVSVLVNGTYAPLFSIAYANGQDQISFQVPYGAATGPGSIFIEVLDYGRTTGTTRTDSYIEDPGIFMYQGTNAVAIVYPSYSLVGPNSPARPGDTIVLYATGLGPLSQNLTDGYGAPSNPPAYTIDPFDVFINGEKCRVLFSGLAPGFVGLYQLNLVLPSDLPNGNLVMRISSPYASSNDAILRILY